MSKPATGPFRGNRRLEPRPPERKPGTDQKPGVDPKLGARDARPESRRERPGARPADGLWLWGRHPVIAALGNPERRRLRLVATAEAAGELAGLSDPPSVETIERAALDRLLPAGAVHQGLALQTTPLPDRSIEDVLDQTRDLGRAIVVLLDQVSDPHNVGAVLRSAAAFGAAAVILPDRGAPEETGTLAKSASGATEHVPLVHVVNLVRTLDQLKKAGFWTVGLAGEAERTLAQHKLSGKIALVMGSEGDGLRRLTREACDLMARLPTSGPISSLNVSNAAAIALYELVREP